MDRSVIWKAGLATVAFGVLHSALAAAATKRAAARVVGHRHRAGLYRPLFIAQSFVSFGALSWYFLSLPREEVYSVEGAPRVLMRAGQAGALVWAFLAGRAVGIGDMTGWHGFRAWLHGEDPPTEPEAQGPAPGRRGMHATGPFRFSRHPLNVAPLVVFWLQPTVTTRWLGFTLVSTAYLVLGSAHEEKRLEEAYGKRYRKYLDSGVSFYLPRPHSG